MLRRRCRFARDFTVAHAVVDGEVETFDRRVLDASGFPLCTVVLGYRSWCWSRKSGWPQEQVAAKMLALRGGKLAWVNIRHIAVS